MAGLSAAAIAAERGHAVTLFEARDSLGGQFELAREVPGKEEFSETLRYFRNRLTDLGVTVSLGVRVYAELVRGFDAVIVATPRIPSRVRRSRSAFSTPNSSKTAVACRLSAPVTR